MQSIREWHIILSGFMQRQGDVNGMVLIWQDLRRLVPREAVCQLHSWDANLADLAELIARLAPDDAPPLVNLYGYSWGGQSAIHLARQLRRRGVPVNHMILSDAVYRHWYALGWWRAFLPWRSLRIPDNVQRVTAFRQKESYPMGHPITADNNGRTKLDPVTWLKTDHCWMDDTPPFRRACIQAARDRPPQQSGERGA